MHKSLSMDCFFFQETQSQQVLKATNGATENGSSDTSSTNESNGNGDPSPNGRQSAPVGTYPPKNGTPNGSRSFHTVSEKTVALNSNVTSPVRSSPSRSGSTALPKIGNDNKGRNNWATKVGRYRTQSPSSSDSSSSESSSEDSSSDDSG